MGAAEADETTASPLQPHLSHSQINRYLQCPEQYRLYYVERWRPRAQRASLVFGSVVHEALAALFREAQEPAEHFGRAWSQASGHDLAYGARESPERLLALGLDLLGQFMKRERVRLSNVQAVEQQFSLAITSLEPPFNGVVDLIADLDGTPTVVDFKTSGMRYARHDVDLSDQLTAYQLASPDTRQLALCVLVKTSQPTIEWHVTRRSREQILEYLTKVHLVAGAIAARHFYKRPGKWCSWCEFLPLCLGDAKKVRETLIQIR